MITDVYKNVKDFSSVKNVAEQEYTKINNSR